MSKLVKQSDFDLLVQDSIEEGQSIHESVEDVLKSFDEEGFKTRMIFVYKSNDELKEKNEIQKKIESIKKCSSDLESFVNANFALQSIAQLLRNEGNRSSQRSVVGCLKLCYACCMIETLIKLLVVKEEDEEEVGSDDDSDSVDKDADNLHKITSVLSVINLMLDMRARGKDEYDNDLSSFLSIELSKESADVFSARMEEELTEPKVAVLMLETLRHLVSSADNARVLVEAGIRDHLVLLSRINTKGGSSSDVRDAVSALLTHLDTITAVI
eukprot:gene12175-25551_t